MRKVPKLRFKEFSDEWEEKKLGEIAELIDGDRGKNYPNEKEILEKGILFLSTSNFSDNKLILNKKNRYISQEKFDLLTKGKVTSQDLIITLRGSIGNIVVFENDKFSTAFINAQMMIIRPNINNKYYLYYLFQTLKSKKEIENMSSGSAQPQLTKKDLKSFKLFYPSFQEQEKIVNFLSSVDKKISLIEEKLELFKEYKKGVMQKIFSQELRFKDNEGNDYPQWEEKRLGEILKIGSGKDYKHLNKGNIPVYGTGGIITRVDSYIYNGESVGIGRKGTINKPVFFNKKFWTVDTLFYTYDFKNALPKFIYYIFNNIDWLSYNEATGVPSLSKITIQKIKINIPILEEQQKIANFLFSIDTKIEKIERELENLKEFKKGLLQQMFV